MYVEGRTVVAWSCRGVAGRQPVPASSVALVTITNPTWICGSVSRHAQAANAASAVHAGRVPGGDGVRQCWSARSARLKAVVGVLPRPQAGGRPVPLGCAPRGRSLARVEPARSEGREGAAWRRTAGAEGQVRAAHRPRRVHVRVRGRADRQAHPAAAGRPRGGDGGHVSRASDHSLRVVADRVPHGMVRRAVGTSGPAP